MAVTTNDVMRSLPLLAAVLGNRYGVKIIQGGDAAWSDGTNNVVHLPSLKVQSDEETLALVRGYIDHEAGGHLRHTDFEAMKAANMGRRLMHLWNSIEDWRVEEKLIDIYPGCRANLTYLIEKFFVREWGENSTERPDALPYEYCLLTCRKWAVPEVEANWADSGGKLEKAYPGLRAEMDALLERCREKCADTKEAIKHARELYAAIRRHAPATPPEPPKTDGSAGVQQGGQAQKKPQQRQRQRQKNANQQGAIGSQLNADDGLPADMGTMISNALGKTAQIESELQRTGIAVPENRKVMPLYDDERSASLRTSSGLRARLAGTLQAQSLRKVAPGRRGRLDGRSLHKVFVSDPKIFRRDAGAQAVDTAVHLLVDVSGSMAGSGIKTARQAAYALAVALDGIPGVNPGVTAFPATTFDKATVLPVLRHGQRVHSNFSLEATGSTPLTEALLWTIQEIHRLKEPRKIVLVITDGCPDNPITCRDAIAEAGKLGVEIYGIGVEDNTIEHLLPKRSVVVNSLDELTPKLFGLLQRVLVRGR